MRSRIALATALAMLVGMLSFLPAQPALAATVHGAGTVHGGIYSDQFSSGSDLDALAAATGNRATFGGTFLSVNEDTGPAQVGQWSNTREKLDQVWKGKATPFVNLDIPATAQSIASGNWDPQIHRWIGHLQLYLNLGEGRSLVIAPMQEMNGNWVSYGCTPASYRNAYRRVVDLIRSHGIDETKVRFAFAPNGWTTPGCGSIADYYPGDSYVDVIGISAYRWPGEHSVYQVMGGTIDQLASWYPTKPLVIAQTAASPSSSKSQWIREAFSWAASHPNVVALIYFNFIKEHDWRVWFGSSVDPGWRDGMLQGTTAYQWPLTSWFQKGAMTLAYPPGVNLCPPGADCDTTAFQDSGGQFRILNYATSGLSLISNTFFYGNPGDVAFSGDWNCDGTDTLGLYRRSDGYVYLRNSNTQGIADVSFYFGNPGDFPVAGDFNGNGCDTVSIYRPSEARFYIINKLGSNSGGLGVAEYSFLFGNPGDKPFVGDFDGDGVDTIGLHRESTGLVYFRNSNTTGIAHAQFVYGNPGDRLVAGDWNGNGHDSVGVYRPSTGLFYARNSNTPGNADSQVFVGPQSGVVSIRP